MRTARIEGPRLGRWLACLAAVSALLLAAEMWSDRASLAVRASPVVPIPFPRDYRTALAEVDRALATASERADLDDGSWLAHEMLARAWFERGRMTGSYRDYAAADAALRRSFELAPAGSGPHFLQAVFDLSMHRLARAEAQLELIGRYVVPPDRGDRAEIEAMRGDIAFYRGDEEEALRRYDQADQLQPGTADFRRAVHLAATGQPDRALGMIDRMERQGDRPSARAAGWTELQRGIVALDRGRVAQAREHFARANSIYPGDWLIEEHLAETLALSGELAEAGRRYVDLVRRTGSPEFMDAIAAIARRRGDAASAARWTRRASIVWQERLRAFPEASYGHAFDHCLSAGDARCALTLAIRNHQARPYGESKAMLVEALALAGHESEARAMLGELLRTSWRSRRTRAIADRLGA